MKLILAIFAFAGLNAFAAQAPEVLNFQYEAGLQKIVPMPNYPGVVKGEPTPDSKIENVSLVLDKHDTENLYGENYSGEIKRTRTIDGKTYTYWFSIAHFVNNPNFVYLISLHVWNDAGDQFVGNSIMLADDHLPVSMSLFNNGLARDPMKVGYQPFVEFGTKVKF